jgi:glycosyltransferase involved in cell wall biosynthesis
MLSGTGHNLIQIFIPTWNSERTIKECIESLKQTNLDIDITVVDNFSTDATVKIARSARAKTVSLKANVGQARTWICRNATTDWFVMVDSDAMACDGWLEQLFTFKDSFKDRRLAAVCCSPLERQVTNDVKLKRALQANSTKSAKYYSKPFKNEGRFAVSLCLVRTDAVRNFETNHAVLEDILFGWYVNDHGWNYYTVPIPYFHKPLLTKGNTVRRARIMGAWMRKIRYTSLPALLFNLFRVPATSPCGAKTQNFKVYVNLIVGWLTHSRYTTDYQWAR